MSDKKWFEYQNANFKFLNDVYLELKRAETKFPKGENLATALMEEVGELAQALLHIEEKGASPQRVYEEAVQVATVAMRIAISGCVEHGYGGTKCHYLGCKNPAIGGPCVLCYE